MALRILARWCARRLKPWLTTMVAVGSILSVQRAAAAPLGNGRTISIAGAVWAVPKEGAGSTMFYRRQPQRWSPALLARLRHSGFGAIRLMTTPVPLMADDDQARGRALEAITALLDDAAGAGLSVIVDMHFWPTDMPLSADGVLLDPVQRAALVRGQVALARVLAARPAGGVALELFNEPFCAANRDGIDWAVVQQSMVKTVRAVAPGLPLVLTGCRGLLSSLAAIDARPYQMDRNLYWTFHYYEPEAFVGQELTGLRSVPFPPDPSLAQSATAMATMVPAGMGPKRSHALHVLRGYLTRYRGRATVRARMAELASWAERNGIRPDHIHVGEFGAIMTNRPTMLPLRPDQLRWTRMMREEFERQHFGWGFFPMPEKGNMNYDVRTNYFRADILGALGLRTP